VFCVGVGLSGLDNKFDENKANNIYWAKSTARIKVLYFISYEFHSEVMLLIDKWNK